MNHLYAVIMAGGVGTRLWPYSRQARPKQFHDLLGVGRSMLQLTVERLAPMIPPERILVVTNRQYVQQVHEQIPGLMTEHVLGEPQGRNTAPCIAYAAYKLLACDPQATMVVLPADHAVKDPAGFRDTLQVAVQKAEEGALVTLGIQPTRPDTGYGYIQFEPGATGEQVFRVKTFTEKPELELAQKFVDSGDFLWNAGVFVWQAKTIARQLEALLPGVAEPFVEGKKSYYTELEPAMVETAYSLCPNISIDYGVMEKADQVFVVPGDFGWSDLGTFKSIHELSHQTPEGNAIQGSTMLYETTDSLIRTSGDGLIVACGLEGFLVVEHEGVLMICPKDQEQRVRQFVADAKEKHGSKYI